MALLTEDQQNVAVNALATTLGKPVSEIETILSGEKPGDVDTLVSARIKTIRDEGDKGGRGKLQKLANKKAKELFGLDVEPETVDELLDQIKVGYKPTVDPSTFTEEQVKTHPAFRTLETTLKTKEEEHKKALESAKAEGLSIAMKERLTAKAQKALQEFGAVISDDPKIAAVQERMYLEQLDGVETKDVDGKIEFWKAGKRIENDKLFPVTEADFFKDLVGKTYTTKVSDQADSTGLPPGAGGSGGGQQNGTFTHFKGVVPKTEAEKDAILNDRQKYTVDAREEVLKYWNEQNTKK